MSKSKHRGRKTSDRKWSAPAEEVWIYKNPDRIASIRRGIKEAESGRLVSIDLCHIEDNEYDSESTD